MSEPLARDPVFGEVARALRPRARSPLGSAAQWLAEVAWLEVEFRVGAVDLDERRRLEGLRALAVRPDGWGVIGCPRFALAEGKAMGAVQRALLAAHDNACRPHASPRVMGIVNVTPDSFSDGGLHAATQSAIEHGIALARAGADVLDVGGESTRPGSRGIEADVELARVVPVVRGLAAALPGVALSVDTQKSAVASAALDAGAGIVNDVSAGRADPAMLAVVAERGACFVAMHMQGTPADMQAAPRYTHVVSEVVEFLRERASACLEAGIARERVWVDPGIGFGKTLEHNLELLASLSELRSLGLPVLLGASRKSFIAALHPPSRDDRARVGGTAAAVTLGVQAGVDLFRVHDVGPVREAIAVASAVVRHDLERRRIGRRDR